MQPLLLLLSLISAVEKEHFPGHQSFPTKGKLTAGACGISVAISKNQTQTETKTSIRAGYRYEHSKSKTERQTGLAALHSP